MIFEINNQLLTSKLNIILLVN